MNNTDRFTGKARAYAQGRPDYPASVVGLLTQESRRENPRLADIGSGTGILSRAMLERGCWLGMDRFGFCDKDLGLEPRVDTIAALCKAGWGHRLLLSHDWAAYLAFWDSWETTKNSDWMHLEEDYTFIHRRVLPALQEKGLDQKAIDALLIDNPRNFFVGE